MDLPHQAKNACIRAKLHVESFEYAPGLGVDGSASVPATVVLCHGFGGSARNFRPQARAVRGRARVVLYDMRGHARSEKPLAVDAYRYDCLVEDLGLVVDEFAAGKVIVGGLSLGAAVALDFALRRPDRVAGLMLAAYPASPDELESWALEFAQAIDELGLEMAGERHVWGAASRFDEQARQLIRMGFMEHSPWALTALLRRSLATLGAIEDRTNQLQSIRVPTRIVVGGDDAGSIGPCRRLARLIPESSLSVFEGAGHVVNLACATEFNEELDRLIAKVMK